MFSLFNQLIPREHSTTSITVKQQPNIIKQDEPSILELFVGLKNAVKNVVDTLEEEERKSVEKENKSKLYLSANAPWENLPTNDPKIVEEVTVKILEIAKHPKNILDVSPDVASTYPSLSDDERVAQAIQALDKDPLLAKLRYSLVPKIISEDQFWRNYFYRVSIIKQAYGLSINTNTTTTTTITTTTTTSIPKTKDSSASTKKVTTTPTTTSKMTASISNVLEGDTANESDHFSGEFASEFDSGDSAVSPSVSLVTWSKFEDNNRSNIGDVDSDNENDDISLLQQGSMFVVDDEENNS